MNFKEFSTKNRLSIWLIFANLMVVATMMHPSFASLIAITVSLGLSFAIRTVAHIEGRRS